METFNSRFVVVTVILAVAVMFPTLTRAELKTGGAVSLKIGGMSLQDTNQVLGQFSVPNTPVEIDQTSKSSFVFGWELRLPHGVAVGTEFLRYRNRFAPTSAPANTGDAQVQVFAVTGKKYFLTESSLRPYIGGGIGYGFTDINNKPSGGVLDDYNSHFLAHGVVGAEWRIDNLSFLLEARILEFAINANKTDYDPSGVGAFMGIGFNW